MLPEQLLDGFANGCFGATGLIEQYSSLFRSGIERRVKQLLYLFPIRRSHGHPYWTSTHIGPTQLAF